LACLAGCGSINANKTQVLTDSAKEVFGWSERNAIPSQLPPQFVYLKVEVQGRAPALFVLGYVDADPLGDIEVWYSAVRETLKLQNGRIVGTTGLDADWRQVSYPKPPAPWSAAISFMSSTVSSAASVSPYERLRDVMPGYHMGIRETVQWTPGTPPRVATDGIIYPQLQWVSEVARPNGSSAANNSAPEAVPAAWFGVDGQTHVVLASYQCLSKDLCLRLQRWLATSKAPTP
jgi:hypothetical protein